MRRMLGVLAIALAARAGPAQTIAVRAGVSISADTVRVGDPFLLMIGIRVPSGATIEFPAIPDSTAAVQALDPRLIRSVQDSAGVLQYATYRLAAWNVGTQPILIGDVVVHQGRVTRRVSMGGHSVFVRSVLPADSAQRVPKPPRDLFEDRVFPWWWIVAALVVAACVALIWWWRRRRRRGRPRLVVIVDPFERAEQEFVRIEGLGLLEVGERSRYIALVTEVLRDYLAARFSEAPLSLTSIEVVHALRSQPTLPLERAALFLNEADLIKFARRPVSSERARELAREARAVVRDEHAASQPRQAVAA